MLVGESHHLVEFHTLGISQCYIRPSDLLAIEQNLEFGMHHVRPPIEWMHMQQRWN